MLSWRTHNHINYYISKDREMTCTLTWAVWLWGFVRFEQKNENDKLRISFKNAMSSFYYINRSWKNYKTLNIVSFWGMWFRYRFTSSQFKLLYSRNMPIILLVFIFALFLTTAPFACAKTKQQLNMCNYDEQTISWNNFTLFVLICIVGIKCSPALIRMFYIFLNDVKYLVD